MDDESPITGKRARPTSLEEGIQRKVPKNNIDDLNGLLDEIINGQLDVTVPAGVASATTTAAAGVLYTELLRIIEEKNAELTARQESLQEATRQEVAQEEARQLIEENVQMMNAINEAMARSNDILPRQQRIELNRRIMKIISTSISQFEVNEQLNHEADVIRTNIRGLFNGLIQYYTEMAAYGYENTPEILSRFGAIIAGSALIGGTIYSPTTIGTSGSLLVVLSSYLQTATSTATGLYFLQRGGLPIQEMLQNIGGNTVQCLRSGCQQLGSKLNSFFELGVNALTGYVAGGYQDLDFNWDSESGNFTISDKGTIASSSVSTTSSAASAKTAIERILDVPEERQIDELIEVIVPISEINITGQQVEVDEPLTQSDFDSQSEFNSQSQGFGDIDGGKMRKSRRHIKSKRTRRARKGRKARKGRITKKGRKHHRTMKRYSSKGRR